MTATESQDACLAHTVAPTAHVFQILDDGQVQVKVFDNEVMRSAFLFYTKSSVRPCDMHRVVSTSDGPVMSSQQFMVMAKDLELMEPEGEGQKERSGLFPAGTCNRACSSHDACSTVMMHAHNLSGRYACQLGVPAVSLIACGNPGQLSFSYMYAGLMKADEGEGLAATQQHNNHSTG